MHQMVELIEAQKVEVMVSNLIYLLVPLLETQMAHSIFLGMVLNLDLMIQILMVCWILLEMVLETEMSSDWSMVSGFVPMMDLLMSLKKATRKGFV